MIEKIKINNVIFSKKEYNTLETKVNKKSINL